MRKLIQQLSAILLLTGVVGCGLSKPNVFHPGTQQHQQYKATLHDPYPDNVAGPRVDGGRPMEFQKPLPEPVRNRWLRDSWWQQ
jgi:predicted small lipoprotein YifL